MNAPKPLLAVTAAVLACALGEAILTVGLETRLWVTLYESAILALSAAWALYALLRPVPLATSRVLIPLLAIVALGPIQLLAGLTVSRWETEVAIVRWIVCLAAYFLALQIGAHPEMRTHLLRALLLFGFVFSAAAAVQNLNDPSKVFGYFDPYEPANYMGPFSNKDHYASYVQLLLPIALYEALAARPRVIRSPLIATLIAAILFASVIEGASRAGSFLVFAETVVILVLAYRRGLPGQRNSIRRIAMLLAGLTALTVAIGWTRLWERVQEADPYLARQQILASCVEMIRAKPLTGFGLGNFENTYPAYAHFDVGEVLGHAHNDWVEWVIEGGFPLMLLMAGVVMLSARGLWRSVWGLGVLSVLVHSLIDFPMQRPAIALWLFVILGLSEAGAGDGDRTRNQQLGRL